jgi:hypothetical protein
VKYVARLLLEMIHMTHAEKIKKIVKILKKNFPDTDNARAIHIGFQIVEALEEPASKVEIKPDERVP